MITGSLTSSSTQLPMALAPAHVTVSLSHRVLDFQQSLNNFNAITGLRDTPTLTFKQAIQHMLGGFASCGDRLG